MPWPPRGDASTFLRGREGAKELKLYVQCYKVCRRYFIASSFSWLKRGWTIGEVLQANLRALVQNIEQWRNRLS